ncbi:MAG: MFS transporter, partial [Pirellulales bacterium]
RPTPASTVSPPFPRRQTRPAKRVRSPPPIPRADLLVYDRSFWFAYLANTSLMIAVSLLFRYSDFIHLLGGSELQLGWIVGVGAVGSLLMRLAQGVGIDRYGPRKIWLISLLAVIVTLFLHIWVTRVDTPGIYFLRAAYHTGLAGAFGASITYIARRAPVIRMAELIGMLGSSGFVGMIVGTQLGDFLCRAEPLSRFHLDRLFLVAAAVATCSLLAAWLATRGESRPVRRKRLPTLWIVRRYHPGKLILMGLMMGIGVGLPGTFLRPFAESLGISTIGTFFGVYAVTAFGLRMATRRLPERIGIRPTILLGMVCLAGSLLLYLVVQSPWQLAIPAVVAGAAHALLFPSVVAGCSQTFPDRYRGLGTTLGLGAFDLGNLIGMPISGSLVYAADQAGLPGYPVLFVSLAALLLLFSGYYAIGVAGRQGQSRLARVR